MLPKSSRNSFLNPERTWQLRDNLTAYDAAYVALAELLSAPLVTSDAHLARATGPRCAIELIRAGRAD